MTDEDKTNQDATTANAESTAQNTTASTNGAGAQEQDMSWLPKRLREAEQSAIKKFLSKLGVEKPEDLEARLKKADELQQAQMTETERLTAQLDKLQKDKEAAEARAAELEAQRVNDRLDSAIRTVASTSRAEIPDDVIEHARRHFADDVTGLLDKNGDIDAKRVEALVEKVKKARPGWFANGGPGSPSNRGGKVPEPGGKDKEAARLAMKQQIRRMT